MIDAATRWEIIEKEPCGCSTELAHVPGAPEPQKVFWPCKAHEDAAYEAFLRARRGAS